MRRSAINSFDVLIRFTHLEPQEDFVQLRIFADTEQDAKKLALKEFWRVRSATPHPAVEIDHIKVAQT
jgi:hypothetical protein